ncbi:MAG TPA: hypothetical protein PKD86_15380 [Gemmatales bacterium]|nr:hypothetical protein [Gemmatales bacterium]HMP60726.1 hypothetical protein [Gemmatales bacterium]
MSWWRRVAPLWHYGLWRGLGLRSAGRRLVGDLGSGHETQAMLAGMLLTRAGRASLPLLGEAAERGEDLENVLPLLADLGDRTHEPLMRACASRTDEPSVARAAQQAVKLLEERQARV